METKTEKIVKQNCTETENVPMWVQERHELFIKSFNEQAFNISFACRTAGISRATYYFWMKRYPSFRRDLEEAIERKKDFVETALMKAISDGEVPAIIFANKTLNKDRGYVERTEHAIAGEIRVVFDKEDQGL